jgi:ATP-binding cassette subfamily C protein
VALRERVVKTPTVLQLEAVECGAAALAIILSHYGRVEPLPTLRQACGVSRDGSKASSILEAARGYGMIAKGFSKQIEAVRELEPPFIVFWNFDHFLVVEGFGKREVYLNDPAIGHRAVSLAEFERRFTGVVLVLRPGPDFSRGGRPPSAVRAVATRLAGAGMPLGYCVLAGFLLVIPTLAMAGLSRVFLDSVLIERRVEWLRPILLAIAGTALIQTGLRVLQRRYLRRLRLMLAIRFSCRFMWKLLELPALFYAQRFSGEVAHRSRLNDKIADLLSGRLVQSCIDAVMMIFYALAMCLYDGLLTGIAAGAAVCNAVVLRWISKRRVEANMRVLQEYGKSYGAALAGLQSIETIKSTGLESHFFQKWSGHYARAAVARQDLELSNTTLTVLPLFLGAVATALVLMVGAYRIIGGQLSIGELVAFQTLMFAFLAPVSNLVLMGGLLQELRGDLQRLDDVLDNPADGSPVAGDLRDDRGRRIVRLEGHVDLQDVTFGYSPLQTPVLENFSLSIEPGRRVALVGRSGSGKSTLLKLISGELTAWDGRILFDRIPRERIPEDVLVNSFSMVEQDIFLFTGTVRENLTLWDGTVEDTQIVQACEDARIHDEVLELPGGYDGALLEGGCNVSGGQAQRLEIARALVNDPAILVLDEATSALDAETEHAVLERLRSRPSTMFIVSHRLSAIRDCDEILVLENGKVMERGTHDELWERKELYHRLVGMENGLIDA